MHSNMIIISKNRISVKRKNNHFKIQSKYIAKSKHFTLILSSTIDSNFGKIDVRKLTNGIESTFYSFSIAKKNHV